MARKRARKERKASPKRELKCFWMGRYVSDVLCRLEDAAAAMKAGDDATAQGHFGSVAAAASDLARGLKGPGATAARLIHGDAEEIARKLAGRQRDLRFDERQMLFQHAYQLRDAAQSVAAAADVNCGRKERKKEVMLKRLPRLRPPIPSFGK